jgi:hypothetical protein
MLGDARKLVLEMEAFVKLMIPTRRRIPWTVFEADLVLWPAELDSVMQHVFTSDPQSVDSNSEFLTMTSRQPLLSLLADQPFDCSVELIVCNEALTMME